MLDIQECRMIRGRPGVEETALDLRVWSRPIEVEGEPFSVFSMVDISDEKRREALERIFFHDVLNTAGGVKGLADLMVQVGMNESGIREVAGMVAESADHLLDEISAQRALSAAESRELQVTAQALHSLELLNQLTRVFHSYCLAASKTIQVDPMASDITLVSDAVLLQRVLMNLAKNALEATAAGGTVTLGAHAEGDLVSFTVHNATVMPQDVQSQVFARSFSTKGSGRGLGTYSIKLITERYLGGKVSFVSNAEIGTRFTVSYPRTIPSSLAGSPHAG
jgi:signal transduction histidine kinase